MNPIETALMLMIAVKRLLIVLGNSD